jgi:hypothetical protein
VQRATAISVLSLAALAGCSAPLGLVTLALPAMSSVTPSATGIPLSVTTFGTYEFVSVQQTGQIFTYNISSGIQVLAAEPYLTPCAYPSAMAASTIAGAAVMAVACYDTGALLTLAIHPDGSLTALGQVSGLPSPYPGIALDGTDIFLPLYGTSRVANGAVARISFADPTNPVVTGIATLQSPSPGAFANPVFLTLANGYLYISAGSESAPISTSSTIQVVDEATLSVVGSPFVVVHSPQQIAIQGSVAYAVFYDAAQMESIDISNPTSLRTMQILPFTASPACHALPVLVQDNTAYVGCYPEGVINRLDVTDPSHMRQLSTIPAIPAPQDLQIAGHSLLATSSANGGSVFHIDLNATY